MSFWLHKLKLKNKDSQHLLQLYSQTKQSVILEVISERFCNDIYHYLCSLTATSNVDDIMQNIWLSLINSKSEYQATASAKTYLFGIARKRLIDWQRKQSFFSSNANDEFDMLHIKSNELTHDESIYQEQIKTQFDQALMTLKFNKQEAFILQQEGFSILEISEITTSSVDTIKSRIKSAKQILTQQLRSTI